MQKRIWLAAALALVAGGVQAADESKLTAAPKVNELRTKVTSGERTVVSVTTNEKFSVALIGVPVEVQLPNSCVSLVGQFDSEVQVRQPRHRVATHIRLIGLTDATKGACTEVVRTTKTLVTVALRLPKKLPAGRVFFDHVLIGNKWVQVSFKTPAATKPAPVLPKPGPKPQPKPAPAPAPTPKPL